MTSPPRRASAASAKARRSDCTRHRSRAVLTVVCDAKGAADANRDSLVGQSHGRNLGQVRAALRFGARGARFGAGSRGRGPSLALRYDRECARRVCAAELSAERLGPGRRVTQGDGADPDLSEGCGDGAGYMSGPLGRVRVRVTRVGRGHAGLTLQPHTKLTGSRSAAAPPPSPLPKHHHHHYG